MHLPGCYQCNSARPSVVCVPSRSDCGLPESGLVFANFSAAEKITPPVFSVWMRLLDAAAGSTLWLLAGSPRAQANLAREAALRGVDPERIVFAPQLPVGDHIARHAAADLFLDTFPYGAHTVGSDALWAGLPLLTCVGESFASRVAASLLHAVGLSELITGSLVEYEALALRLAGDPPRLAELRARLVRNRAACRLFDAERFAREIEAAYRQMITTWEAGHRAGRVRKPWADT